MDLQVNNDTSSTLPKILILSFWTPPAVRPRAIMIGKIVSEMMRQKIQPVILTFDICGKWNIDLPIYSLSPFVVKKNIFSKIPFIRTLSANVDEFLYYRKSLKQAETVIKKHQIQAIFSFSNPQSSNILGALIRKKKKIPFISYFSDPWSDNPYNTFTFLQNLKTRFLERFVVKWSDRIGFTNSEALNLVMRKYPPKWEQKSLVLPHCFDPRDYSQKLENHNEKFVISHIGAFYKKRTPEALFAAIKKILDRKILNPRELSIKLVGGTLDYADYGLDNLNNLIKKYKLENIVEIIPPVSHKESLQVMQASHLLIVIDADMEKSPFLPSKVVDYAGSKIPIVAITPKESPTAKFLHSLGFLAFDHSEIDKLGDFLIKAITEGIKNEPNQSFLENYRSENVVKKLLSEIRSLIDKKANK